MTALAFDRSHIPMTFSALSAVLPLRPIIDSAGFDAAQEVADVLAVLDRRTRDQDDYLESLSILMEAYERQAMPLPLEKSSLTDCLRYLMQAHGMSESDLGRLLGERSLGNAVLSGRRSLSKSHIRVLAARFKVSTDLFLAGEVD